MPIPLIALILAAAASLTVVVLAIVYYQDIVKWFRTRNDIKEADKDNIAFTIKDLTENGDFKIVQGIFNKRTETVVDGQVIQAKDVDADLVATHGNKKLVVYE
jgi:hypothetical protein